jgi:acyl-coenzyme A synthetase/AMP-(fatty) acid ligase
VTDIAGLARVIESQQITATVTTPITLARLIDTLDLARHTLRFVLVGGKNFSPTQKKAALDALGPVVYEYYGSSETGVNTIAEPQDLLLHPDSVGRPYSGNRVLAVDDADRPLPPGVPGRIVAAGYLGMDHYAVGETPVLHIEGERFLVTPDRGYLDAEGRLHVFNRSSGQDGNFDVYAVEETLRHHIGLHDVAIALDSAAAGSRQRSGDVALVLAAGSSDAARIAAVASARAVVRQAGIQDRRVEVVAAIPYNLSGKVRWSALADLLAGQQDDIVPQRRAA